MAYSGSTAAILSNYSEVLKTFYLPAIQDQLNHDTILADKIETNEEDVSGTDATIECHYGRTKGTGARSDGDYLPEADYQKFKKMVVPMRYDYGRVTFSGPTIAATRDAKGAYARVVDTEITGLVRDMKKETNRKLWGCGYGVLGRWRSGATTSQTWQKQYLANISGSVTGCACFGSTFGGKYVSENGNAVPVVLTYSSGITAATVDSTDMSVSAVDDSEDNYDTITCTNPAVTEANGTFFVRGDANGQSARSVTSGGGETFRKEIMGIRGIVTNTDIDDIAIVGDDSGDGTGSTRREGFAGSTESDSLQSLAVGTYTWWKANVDTHSSGRYLGQRALSLKLMQKMFDKVEAKAGKDYGPDMILTTRAIRAEYLDLVSADRRYVNTMELDGGWTALDYNGVPFTVDDDAIDGEVYFLTLKDLQMYRMSDYDWMDKDGALLSRITNYDAYEAVLFRYAELGCKRRNAQGVLCDLAYEEDYS